MLKMKLAIAIAIAAVLLLAPVAYADTGGTTTGQFGAAGATPEVSAIQIFTDIGCTNVANSMDPLTQYYAKVDVSLANNLRHLQTVQATIYYDADGDHSPVPTSGDLHDCAILTCTVSGPTWTIDRGTSTTWQIVSDNCSQPANLDVTSGSWRFAFVPGKVARENAVGHWDAQGKATRNPAQYGVAYVYSKNMNWYGEITVNSPALVDWGEVPLGLTSDNATHNPQHNISVTYIANGDYYEDISSTDWTGGAETVTLNTTGTEPITAPGQFGLKASWHNLLSDNVTVTANPAYAHVDSDELITNETGNIVTDNSLWLSLSTSGIAPVTYSGTVWYQIATR
jgi:hypothetical protein